MKKIFCLLLCFILIVSIFSGCTVEPGMSDLNSNSQQTDFDADKINQEVVERNTDFAFNIFRQLEGEDRGQNIFISPLSISTALAMTYQGAASSTKEAMAEALQYSGLEDELLQESYKNLIPYLKQLDEKVELNISNSIWIREGEDINPEFITANKEVFQALVTSLNFSEQKAAEQINRWIAEATSGKIEKMVDSPIAPDVIMYLINAIYFKGDWAEQFAKEDTFESQFRPEDGSMDQVMMMSRKGKVEYGSGEDFQVVRLPYGDGKTAMYCLLPLPADSSSIHDFIAGLDAEKWATIRNSIAERDEVLLQLPRFKMEYGIKNLNDSLTALGMGEAFTERADFSGIRDGLFISRVLHKAVIEVNEEGSEAAAATAVEMIEMAVERPLTFIADRPFVFLITDEETGTILFMGKMAQAG